MRENMTPWASDDIDKLRYQFNVKAVGALMSSLVFGTAAKAEIYACTKCGYIRCNCKTAAAHKESVIFRDTTEDIKKADIAEYTPKFDACELVEWVYHNNTSTYVRLVSVGRSKGVHAAQIEVDASHRVKLARYWNDRGTWTKLPGCVGGSVKYAKMKLDKILGARDVDLAEAVKHDPKMDRLGSRARNFYTDLVAAVNKNLEIVPRMEPLGDLSDWREQPRVGYGTCVREDAKSVVARITQFPSKWVACTVRTSRERHAGKMWHLGTGKSRNIHFGRALIDWMFMLRALYEAGEKEIHHDTYKGATNSRWGWSKDGMWGSLVIDGACVADVRADSIRLLNTGGTYTTYKSILPLREAVKFVDYYLFR